MEDNTNLFESLLERLSEYGKSGFELAKLKTLDKTSDVVSSIIPHLVVFIIIAVFLLFLNLGLAFWLGEIFGKTWLGFILVAAFYSVAGIVLYLLRKRCKKLISNYIIRQVLK